MRLRSVGREPDGFRDDADVTSAAGASAASSITSTSSGENARTSGSIPRLICSTSSSNGLLVRWPRFTSQRQKLRKVEIVLDSVDDLYLRRNSSSASTRLSIDSDSGERPSRSRMTSKGWLSSTSWPSSWRNTRPQRARSWRRALSEFPVVVPAVTAFARSHSLARWGRGVVAAMPISLRVGAAHG